MTSTENIKSFVVYNFTFTIKESVISLDKNSKILKQKINLYKKSKDKAEQIIAFQKEIIENFEKCIFFCETINNHFMKFKCLENIEHITPSFHLMEDVKELIYETISNKNTKHSYIFSFEDINYLKKFLKTKSENLSKYETQSSDNNKFFNEHHVFLQKLFESKK